MDKQNLLHTYNAMKAEATSVGDFCEKKNAEFQALQQEVVAKQDLLEKTYRALQHAQVRHSVIAKWLEAYGQDLEAETIVQSFTETEEAE